MGTSLLAISRLRVGWASLGRALSGAGASPPPPRERWRYCVWRELNLSAALILLAAVLIGVGLTLVGRHGPASIPPLDKEALWSRVPRSFRRPHLRRDQECGQMAEVCDRGQDTAEAVVPGGESSELGPWQNVIAPITLGNDNDGKIICQALLE